MKKINKLLKLIPAITIAGSITPIIALTACKNSSTNNISIDDDEKTQSVGANNYAIYTIKLSETASVSSLNVSVTTASTSAYSLSASIQSLRDTTLKVKVTATSKYSTVNTTSVKFNLTVSKSGSWSQTISNLTMTGLDDVYTSYSITYETIPTGMTITSKPTTATYRTAVSVVYELEDEYYIDGGNCHVVVGTTDITAKCSISSTLLVIPSNYVTDNITITLATTDTPETYSVTYNLDSNITQVSCPTSATSGTEFVATYTVANGYKFNTSNCSITSGGSNITAYVTFTNTTLTIPATSVIGNIVITLNTTTDSDTGTVTASVGTVTTYTLADAQSTLEDFEMCGVQKVIYLQPTSNVFTATITGTFTDTLFYMDTKKSTYNITLNGVTMCNSASDNTLAAPVFFAKSKNSSTINLILTGTNTMLDRRTVTTDGFYEEDAVFKSQSALNISGTGSLNINDISANKGIYGKGIQTTKGSPITISNGTVNVFSYGTAIQSDGKITISGGTVAADSYLDDGIKTKFADPDEDIEADTFNINKDITISGGTVTVYSARNGISSAHDVITSGSPNIKIYTSKTNASTKVGSPTLDELNMFVRIPASYISYSEIEDNYFTAEFNDGTIEYLTLKKIKSSDGGGGPGQSSTGGYYYFKCDRPLSSACTSFVIKQYANSQFGAKSPTATATSGSVTISNPTSTTNTKDTVIVSSISGSTISAGSSLSTNYKSDIGQGSSVDTTVGSKGIKAKNEVELDGGTITINSNDTGISAGYGTIYCNSATAGDVTYSTGNITVNGATVSIASSTGDGVKAYGIAEVKSGTLEVTNAVEALEAGKIVIGGGVTKLTASDDGVNASEVGIWNTLSSISDNKVTILVSGGVLDVQTNKTSDTDAVDSNNNITMTGGLIVARVPGSSPSSALDAESKTLTASNGTIVVCGAIEPSISGLSKNGSGSWYSAKSYTISYGSGLTYKFTNSTSMNSSCKWYSYSSVTIS